jgi:hypothetical protein
VQELAELPGGQVQRQLVDGLLVVLELLPLVGAVDADGLDRHAERVVGSTSSDQSMR